MINWNLIKYVDLKSMHFDSIDPEDSGIKRGSLSPGHVYWQFSKTKLSGN